MVAVAVGTAVVAAVALGIVAAGAVALEEALHTRLPTEVLRAFLLLSHAQYTTTGVNICPHVLPMSHIPTRQEVFV